MRLVMPLRVGRLAKTATLPRVLIDTRLAGRGRVGGSGPLTCILSTTTAGQEEREEHRRLYPGYLRLNYCTGSGHEKS